MRPPKEGSPSVTSTTALAVAWCRSVAAYVFLVGYVGLVGPPALLVTFVSGRVEHLFRLGVVGAATARRLLGIRLQVEGLDHVDPARPTVYCINHRSNVDAVVYEVMNPACPLLRVLYKAEMGKLPILGPAMRIAGFVPVNRADRERAIEAVDLAVSRLGEGYSFLLAPEGTRNTAAEMRPFKKGAFVMAIKAQVPVVPVALLGTDERMPKGRYVVTPGTVRIRIGEPLPTAGLTLDDRDTLSDRTRAALARLLAG